MSTSVSSYSYNGYSSYNNYQNDMLNSTSWTEKANEDAEKLKAAAAEKTSSTSSTSKTSSTGINVSSSASTSTFLLGYQTTLEDLESAASKLQLSNKDNVFTKYDNALAEAAKHPNDEKYQANVTKARDEVISAVSNFVDKYNNTTNLLSNNQERGSGIGAQLDAFKRMMPSEKTLKALGMSYDTNGKVKLDEDALGEALDKESGYVKELLGGQFGIAERIGSKATSVLDSSVDKIVGSNTTGYNESTKAETVSTSGANAGKKTSTMSDSFLQFASFARSGAYNLSNYYAVSMLNILA